jgi:hypothetical protein
MMLLVHLNRRPDMPHLVDLATDAAISACTIPSAEAWFAVVSAPATTP